MEIHINKLPPKLARSTLVALDTEWFGLDPNKLHRHVPTAKLASLQIAVGNDIYVITEDRKVSKALANIAKGKWVFHTANFDIRHLRPYYTITKSTVDLWDTYIVEKIMYGNYYSDFGLADLSRRYFDYYMSKETRKKFNKVTELTTDMIQYGALDAYYTLKIAEEQVKLCDTPEFSWVKSYWDDVDLPAFWAILDFAGFKIDKESWTNLALQNQDVSDTIKNSLGFNPGSPVQVKKALAVLGLSLESTQETALQEALESTNGSARWAVLVRAILEYRNKSKLASTYGIELLDNHLEDDGKAYCNFDVERAKTSRTSSSDFNLQNIPHDVLYRSKFVASNENYGILKADYDAQELKVLAYIANDPELIRVFNNHEDPHANTARFIFDDSSIGKGDPRRQVGKTTNFGVVYGIGAYGLARQLGIDPETAKSYLDGYYQLYTGVRQYMTQQEQLDIVSTIGGRRIHLNPYSGSSRNQSYNFPIQGSSAEMLKLALGYLHTDWPSDLPFGVTAIVHDEIVVDFPLDRKDEIVGLVRDAMIQAEQSMIPGIPPGVEIKVGKSWGEGEVV